MPPQTLTKKEPTLSFSDIHPFRIQVPQSDLDDLHERLEHAQTIVHWSEFDRGGHFAALEAPDLFVEDVRKFFEDIRQIVDLARTPPHNG
jgi:hypothetical protein